MDNIPQTYVNFDSNAYRDLVEKADYACLKNTVRRLLVAEKQARMQALANPVVAMELSTWLRDDESNSFPIGYLCLAAIGAHCGEGDEHERKLRLLADPDAMICNVLFGEVPRSNRLNTEALASLCIEAYLRLDGTLSSKGAEAVEVYAEYVEQSEREFLDDMFEVVRLGAPEAQTWEDIELDSDLRQSIMKWLRSREFPCTIGRALAAKACGLLNKKPQDHCLYGMGEYLAENLPIPLSMYALMLERILVTGANMKKRNRVNWFWDFHILFGAAPQPVVDGRACLLITSDKDILSAAAQHEPSETVMSFSDYRGSIGY